MFQFVGAWSFVWGEMPTKAPVATGLSGAPQKCFQSGPALTKAGPDGHTRF